MEPTAEETLKLIESDFLEFIDGETQLAIGATFDLSIRDRLRVVMKSTSVNSEIYEDSLAGLRDELEQAEIELTEAQERIAVLEAERDKKSA